MYISELRIRNFRNFFKAKFRFRKGVNTLIGENGSGKTNALHALRLLLDDSLPRNAPSLRETDFCRVLDEDRWKGHWVVISIDFEDLDPSEGCQILKHNTGHMDGTSKGTYSFFFRPKLEVRIKLFEMSNLMLPVEEKQKFLNAITIDDYESIFTGRGAADLLDDEVYTRLAGNFTEFVFPNPDDEDQGELGVRTSFIHKEVSCTFAPALRDVVSDLRGFRSNPLLALLRGTGSNITIEDSDRIVAAVRKLNQDISSLKEIKEISTGIQKSLHSTVGHTYAPAVGIESNMPDNIDKLLQRLTVRVGDGIEDDYRGDLSELSLGGANLIYLALKLLEYEVKTSSDKVVHFLLIEEPEAHIHTHIQKTLFEKQSAQKTQVIVSTHSTHVSSVAKIQSVNVLVQKKNHAEAYQPSNGLEDGVARRVERYLDAVRSTLLFAKGILLVEGTAELLMIPSMLKRVFGQSPDEMGISVVSMDSAFFEHIAIIFHNDRIRRRCSILTDLDEAFIVLPIDPNYDNEDQKRARSAQKKGAERRSALEEFHKSNPWVCSFFARHTFEVDFLIEGNQFEICQVLEKIYVSESTKKKAKTAIRNEDLSISGTEILRLANKEGKGWFSLLLAEKLQLSTCIPSYILRGVAFAAADSLPDNALKLMGLFRISDNDFDQETKTNFPNIVELRKMSVAEFLELYISVMPDDDLTKLIKYLNEYKTK